MHLRTVLALALILVFAPSLAAQDRIATAGDQQSVYIVQPGETLGGIARNLLGSYGEWRRIFEANADVLSDPDLIRPGMELRIPGVGRTAVEVVGDAAGVEVIRGRPDTLAEVTGVVLDGEIPVAVGALPQVVDPDDRRALLRVRPFAPEPAPDYGGARTVFHGAPVVAERVAERPGVMLVPAEERLAVPRSTVDAASWLTARGESVEVLGQVDRVAGDGSARSPRTTLQPFDQVEVTLSDDVGTAVGDLLLAYFEVRRFEGWHVFAPSGVIEVSEVREGGALGRVVAEFDRMELGHRVTRMQPFALQEGVHPVAAERELGGSLIAFRDRQEVYLPGDEGFVDLGDEDGVSIGDEFLAMVGGPDGGFDRVVGRLQVIRVGDGWSTVRLVSTDSPGAMRPGIRLVLDRSMP
ncbi:MAG: LysM peptidoglycan-binding domain-containing protein [Gemmatimonadota bacterium]